MNAARPNIDLTTMIPRVLLYRLMRDSFHKQ